MAETNTELDNTEKAAVFLLALGQDRAAEILRHMGPKEVQIVGSTMASLGCITSDTVNNVLEQFVGTIRNQTALGIDSDEYIRNVLTEALGSDKAGSVIDRILLGRNSKGIEQLKWMDSRSIADMIRLEHPQIISIIISLLDSDQAAEVLSCLPPAIRSDVIMRIATLETVQPSALKELDDIMEKQLSGNTNVKSSTIGGIETAANVLNYVEGSIESEILEKISEIDPDLGQRIQDKMFVFDNLVEVDDRGIQTLLREISTDSLLLALRGADAAFKDKIFSNMSRRAAEMLKDDLEAAAPAKLSDVEAAQKEILAIARRLDEAGEISLGGGSGDEFI
ncbi:MAG: flagellar motor switch protein FliG [Methylococcales bacterium]